MIEFIKHYYLAFSAWWTIITTVLMICVLAWVVIQAKRDSDLSKNLRFKDGDAYFKGSVNAGCGEDINKIK